MKVLVVDDSVIFRTGITRALEKQAGVEVVGVAGNGKIALDKIKQLKPDVITMDLEMPVMDGISAIKEIRKENKEIGIVVFSDQSEVGAKKTLEALTHGADDFVPKSVVKGEGDSVDLIRKELLPKILQFKDRNFSKPAMVPKQKIALTTNATPVAKPFKRPDLVLIGSSTGGPDALRTIFAELKAYSGPPILIVQHMPPVFTTQLAKLLTQACGWTVKEGEHNEVMKEHTCYLAPGDYHMTLSKRIEGYVIKLDQTEKVKSVRPSADVLFNSVADQFVGHVLAVVLTGMGDDGLNGSKKLIEKSSYITIQDQATSTVWGMPRAIFEAKVFDSMLPLKEISNMLKSIR